MRRFIATAGPIWLGAWLAATLLVAGCAGATSRAAATRSPTPLAATSTPSATPTPDVLDEPTPVPVGVGQAWGAYTVRKIPAPLNSTLEADFQSSDTPDGRYLVITVAPIDFIDNKTVVSYLALYDLQTGAITKITPLQGPQEQIVSVATDGRWFIWSETNVNGPGNWYLFLYDRQTGAIKRLAEGSNGTSPTPFVELDHGVAIWSQLTTSPSVLMDDLATSAISTLSTNGGGPLAMSWPWVEYSDGNGAGTQDIRNLVTGQIIQLPVHAAYLALQGTGVAYIPQGLQSVQYIDDFTQPNPRPIYLSVGTNLEFVSMNDRVVVWQTVAEITEVVWDRVQHRMIEIAQNVVEPSLQAIPHYLLWTTNIDNSKGLPYSYIQDLVDTDTLPTSSP